jgi:hypothetical protein
MPSQAVLSLWAMSGLQKYVRMTHLLNRMRSAKGSRISYFARSRRQALERLPLWPLGRSAKKRALLLVAGGLAVQPTGGPFMRQVNERTQKPVDHDLHAGRRRRHDRLGADRDPANQSGARARGSGRRKMTNREGGSHAAAEATEAASAAARRITTRHTDTSRRARPLWKSGSSLRRKRLLDGFAGVVDLLVVRKRANWR